MAAVDGLPKKWGNVRCVYAMAAQSVSLPIYQVALEMGMKIVIGEEKEMRAGTKKRKARIHDMDYVGGEIEGANEKDKKKENKEKKDDCEDKGIGDQLIEFGDGRKMRKRAKKIVNSEVEEHGIKGGLVVDAIVATDDYNHGDDMEQMKSKSTKG